VTNEANQSGSRCCGFAIPDQTITKGFGYSHCHHRSGDWPAPVGAMTKDQWKAGTTKRNSPAWKNPGICYGKPANGESSDRLSSKVSRDKRFRLRGVRKWFFKVPRASKESPGGVRGWPAATPPNTAASRGRRDKEGPERRRSARPSRG